MKLIKALAIFLIVVPLFVFSGAVSAEAAGTEGPDAQEAAETLWKIGLFRGIGDNEDPNFMLDKNTTRLHGETVFLHFVGGNEDMLEGSDDHYSGSTGLKYPYAAYTKTMRYLAGKYETGHDPHSRMTAAHFLTHALRVLGYESGTDFQWDKAWELTDAIGLTSGEFKSTDIINRGDMASILLRMLNTAIKDSELTLLDLFMEDGIFDRLAENGLIRDNGLLESIINGEDGNSSADDTGNNGNGSNNAPSNNNGGNNTTPPPNNDNPGNGDTPTNNPTDDSTKGCECGNSSGGCNCGGETSKCDCDNNSNGCECGDNTVGCECDEETSKCDCDNNSNGCECGNNTVGCECDSNSNGCECKPDSGTGGCDCEPGNSTCDCGDCNTTNCCKGDCACEDCKYSEEPKDDCDTENGCDDPDCENCNKTNGCDGDGDCACGDDCGCENCKYTEEPKDDCDTEDGCDDPDCENCNITNGCDGDGDCACGDDCGCENCKYTEEPNVDCDTEDGCDDPDCENCNITNGCDGDGDCACGDDCGCENCKYPKEPKDDCDTEGGCDDPDCENCNKTNACDGDGDCVCSDDCGCENCKYPKEPKDDCDTEDGCGNSGCPDCNPSDNCDGNNGCDNPGCENCNPQGECDGTCGNSDCPAYVWRNTWPKSLLDVTCEGWETHLSSAAEWVKVRDIGQLPTGADGNPIYTDALITTSCFMFQQTRRAYKFDRTGIYHTLSFTAYNTTGFIARIQIFDYETEILLWSINLDPHSSIKVQNVNISQTAFIEFSAELLNAPTSATHYVNAVILSDPRVDRGTMFNVTPRENPVSFLTATGIGERPLSMGNTSRWQKVINRDELPENRYGNSIYTEALKTSSLFARQNTVVTYTLDRENTYKTLSFDAYNMSPHDIRLIITDADTEAPLLDITILPGASHKINVDIPETARLEFSAQFPNASPITPHNYNALYLCNPVLYLQTGTDSDGGDCSPGDGCNSPDCENCNKTNDSDGDDDCECTDCADSNDGSGEGGCECTDCGYGNDTCDCGGLSCPNHNSGGNHAERCFFCRGNDWCSGCKACLICDPCRHCTGCDRRIFHDFEEYDPYYDSTWLATPELIGDGKWDDIIEWLSNPQNYIACVGSQCRTCTGQRYGTKVTPVIRGWHELVFSNGFSVCARTITCPICNSVIFRDDKIHNFIEGICVECGAIEP